MENILLEAEKYVTDLFINRLATTFLYHNLTHTQRVVTSVNVIATGEALKKNEKLILELSAWFHDVGYINSCENHEEEGVKIVTEFLKKNNVDKEDISQICGLIMATKMKYTPKTLLEKIIRDADSAHFGSKDYTTISNLLRAEWELTFNKLYTDSEWTQENISYYTKHHQFYTNYAITNWQKRKDKNLKTLLKTLKQQKQEEKKVETKAKIKKTSS